MDLLALKQKVFETLQFEKDVEVEFAQHPGLLVCYENGKATEKNWNGCLSRFYRPARRAIISCTPFLASFAGRK